ncbi:unnamed protein product [Rotaria sordida]|uniref:Uncharacterized protein n=1 Tax=Rotaria sordida TaxID=392033 RepID=A0A814ISX3_9BILA|nr:unnamed protein product [Rotaria sordida]CAF1078360.1 unnamed protein product [Rotaria sordida]
MSTNTILICLVILNFITVQYAYRIIPNNEPIQTLFRSYEYSPNDEQTLVNLYNLKQAEEQNLDNSYLILCHPRSSHILCNKLDNFSRRDTGFLRFGRKR